MSDESDDEVLVISDPALVTAIERMAQDEGRSVENVVYDALLAMRERPDREAE